MPPIDPGQNWLEAGITGLPRQREWDAVATVSAPGNPGDEAQFVALDDGRLLVEDAPNVFDPALFAAALVGRIEPPYRAVARCRGEYWAAGASAIEVVLLGLDTRGTDFELVSDGGTRALTIDGMPSGPAGVEALRSLAESRVDGAYSAHAHRLADNLFEVLILPL